PAPGFRGNRIHRDKKGQAQSSEDLAHRKSKLPIVWAQALQFVTEPLKLYHAPPAEEARLANRSRLLPNNASVHRGKAKIAGLAVPHELRVEPLRARLSQKLP